MFTEGDDQVTGSLDSSSGEVGMKSEGQMYVWSSF